MLTYLLTIAGVAYFSIQAEKYREVIQKPAHEDALHHEMRKQGLRYLWLAAAILILVSGLRYGVGADYFAYAHKFYDIQNNFWDKLLHKNEPGSALLLFVCRTLSTDFASATLLTSLITIGLVFFGIQRYSEDYLFSALLFIFIGSWHSSFNAIRQCIAMAILFAGHRFILEQKHWQYLALVILAMCFHVTALFMYPCFYLLNIKKTRLYVICLIAYGIIVFYCQDRFFEIMSEIKGVEQTTQVYSQRAVNALRVLVSFSPLTILLSISINELKTKEHLFYVKIVMLNAVMLLATSTSAYLARISIYTDIYSILAFPCLFKLLPHSTYHNLKIAALLLYFLFWIVEVTRRGTLLPFRWVFER